MFLNFLIPLCFLFSTPTADHAIYISVLEVDHKQLKVKVFMDNLEDAIQNDANSIEGYFLKKIDFKINEQPIQLSLEDIHEEEDSFWITFKVETPKIWKSFYLEAGYLMELFPDQTNVVKVLGDNPQFFSLTRLKPYCSFTN